MWMVRECDECGFEPASLRCDSCQQALCAGCITMLSHTIEGYKGERYQHLCQKCTCSISVDGTTYTGGQLVELHPNKPKGDGHVSRR